MRRQEGIRGAADRGRKRWREGGRRTVDPTATMARIGPRLADHGITRIAQIGGLDRIGIPVAMACRPLSRSVAVSLGKGTSRTAAAVSAAMEAIELWHAERVALPLLRASPADMRQMGRPIADPARLPLRGDPPPPTARLLWVEAEELAGGGRIWVPFDLVHADYTLPLPEGGSWFLATTNGLASGNHPLEARVHALCEVIERDATARWRRATVEERRRWRLDPATVEDQYCRWALERFRAAGIEVAIWATPGPLAVPSFFCLLRDRRDPAGHFASGAGCHLSAPVALLRALLEAAQVRVTYISGARDDLLREEFGEAAQARKARELAPLFAEPPVLALGDLPHHEHPDFAADLERLLAELTGAGFDRVAMVDLTRGEGEIAVVRAVVPGLLLDDHDGRRAG